MATVSVLCTRVRVEEKQLMAALAAAGVPALPLDPSPLPWPVGPIPPGPSAEKADGGAAGVMIDRLQDRAMAAAVLPVWRARGAIILDAGLAATGNRLAVASTMAAAGIPRPQTRLVCSEAAALAALTETGYPATLLPLTPGATEIALLDQDTAEAVLEHRHVLGAKGDIVGLLQLGAPLPEERVTVIVVDERAVAVQDPAGHAAYPARIAGIAEAAATMIGAAVVGVEIVLTAAGPVVWDVHPTPDFRDARVLGHVTAAEAIAEVTARRLGGDASAMPGVNLEVHVGAREGNPNLGREVTNGVALSA